MGRQFITLTMYFYRMPTKNSFSMKLSPSFRQLQTVTMHAYLHMDKRDLVRHTPWRDHLKLIHSSIQKIKIFMNFQEYYQELPCSSNMKQIVINDIFISRYSLKLVLLKFIAKTFAIFFTEMMIQTSKDTLKLNKLEINRLALAKLGSKYRVPKSSLNRQLTHRKRGFSRTMA